MYHLRLKGSHYEMGVKRGKIFNRGRVSFPLRLDAFQLEHGRKSEKILRSFFPEVCEEIRGVSDTAGADYLYFASWMLCMGCCMYNLEQNIPVEIRGCTAFAYVKGEKNYTKLYFNCHMNVVICIWSSFNTHGHTPTHAKTCM